MTIQASRNQLAGQGPPGRAPIETGTGPCLRDLPDLLTVPEVAALLRIGRGKAYALVRRGNLPSVKLGRTLRVPKAAIERLASHGREDVKEVDCDE